MQSRDIHCLLGQRMAHIEALIRHSETLHLEQPLTPHEDELSVLRQAMTNMLAIMRPIVDGVTAWEHYKACELPMTAPPMPRTSQIARM